MKLPYKVYSFKFYWIANYRIRKFGFRIKKILFNTQDFIDVEKYKTKSSITYFRLTILSILRAVLSIIILLIIEHASNIYWEKNMDEIPVGITNIIQIIPRPTYPRDKDAILYLLSVIASVTGVTLALFYTILATLASTAYAKVQSSIRNLIIYDRDTQSYLHRLTNLTATSITVLLSLSLGYMPGNLILLVLFIYALSTFFGILKIGMGVYNYFEPSNIARSVVSNMIKTIKNVTINGLFWDDKNFQNHNYKNAFSQTENLKLITNLCIKGDDLNESSFKSIIQSSILVLRFYLVEKSKIPRESFWFPEVLEHKSYFESDMSARALARNTHTFILPTKIHNKYWLEDRIINNISLSLETVIQHKHVKAFADAIQLTYPLLKDLSLSLDIKTGESILKHLNKNLKSIKSTKIDDKSEILYDDWLEYMEALEVYSLAIFSFQFGVFERAIAFNAEKIAAEYKKITWGRVNTVYSTDFIPELYELLDQINLFVTNEKVVEGIRVTPDWYFLQQITSTHLGTLITKIEQAVNIYDTYFLETAAYYDVNKNALLCSFLVQKGDEFLSKYKFALVRLATTLNGLDTLEVFEKEFKWEKPNINKLQEKLNEYEQKGIKYLIKHAKDISILKWNSQFPDVFAHTYSILSNNINNSFSNNDISSFKEVFPAFLKATISGYNTLIKNFQGYAMPYRITYQTIIDSMEISGYAYLYSYLYQEPEYWEIVKSSWNDSFPITESNITLATSSYAIYKTPSLATGINFGEKHQRALTFQRALKDISESNPKLLQDPDRFIEPFIKIGNHHSFYEESELFIEMYLFTFIDAKNSVNLFKRHLFDYWLNIIARPQNKGYDY